MDRSQNDVPKSTKKIISGKTFLDGASFGWHLCNSRLTNPDLFATPQEWQKLTKWLKRHLKNNKSNN